MKCRHLFQSAAICAAGLLATSAVRADVVNNVGATLSPLSAGQIVVASNPLDGNGNSSGGSLNYYNNQFVGQTFTTGNNSGGYQLNSVSVWDQWEQSGGFASGNTITLNIFTPGATSMLYTGTGTVATAGSNGAWITYTVTAPVTLAANTLYAYSIGTNNGYSALGLTVGDGASSGAGSASSQLATYGYTATGTTPTYWTGANWGTNPAAAAVSATNDPTDVFTDSAEFQVVATPVTAVPEPASLAVFSLGSLALLVGCRRARRGFKPA